MPPRCPPRDRKATETALRGKITTLGTELRSEIAELRSELRGEMAELRTDLHDSIASVRAEIASLRTDMKGIEAKIEAAQSTTIKRGVGIVGFQGIAILGAAVILSRLLAH